MGILRKTPACLAFTFVLAVLASPFSTLADEPPKLYWAYQPVSKVALPEVRDKNWPANPIDLFILQKLEAQGLTPNPRTERVALVRRLFYDLTGLPPPPEEVDALLADSAPDAYERLVDRLLNSPHYGEKWGRHWLDLVRFAESNGYERDGPKPLAWRYRDYVIRSFNADKPFDWFVKEQLAGDELAPGDPDSIIATGFYRLGLFDDEPADPAQARFDELDDIVTTVSQVFLGMTVNCARCHDHKIDPIPQADYYRLLSFFQEIPRFSNDLNPVSSSTVTEIAPAGIRAQHEVEDRARVRQLSEITTALRRLEEEAIRKMPAQDQRAAEGPERQQVIRQKLKQFMTAEQMEEYASLRAKQRSMLAATAGPRDLAMSVNHCAVNPGPTHIMIRGNPHIAGKEVTPAFPTAFALPPPSIPAPPKDAHSSGRRTALANWIASPENPLTARVIVNRLWQHHFGRGIVATPNDFGKFGTAPSHPELLDWLAGEFIRSGWSLKHLHKLILMSSTYQMSPRANEPSLQVDSATALYWRFPMRRLTAEEIRDSMLSVSGQLNLKAGGESVFPPIPQEVLAGQSRPGDGWGKSSPQEAARRSIYVFVKRSLQVPLLAHHDQADTDSSCPVRYATTVPTQALNLLNGEFSQKQAAAFAERLECEHPRDLPAQIERAIRLTTARSPARTEIQKDVEFIQKLQMEGKLSAHEALRYYCLMLLNANEFVYLD
jgi:hypothetical protein